ncbi:hypothetical protein FK216_14820 [Moraxellaceae bacterium AER2_44_116]|nr:hypothetical protein FK216_14820 [Moraxellaceae bacterium AER2_44_116]
MKLWLAILSLYQNTSCFDTTKRDSVLCKKSLEINNEIEREVKKVAEARFEKLCVEKGQIIKELDKKIKDLENKINQFKSQNRSWMKFE